MTMLWALFRKLVDGRLRAGIGITINDCGEGLMGRIQLFDIADSGSGAGFFAAD
jgi:hypothetical protein